MLGNLQARGAPGCAGALPPAARGGWALLPQGGGLQRMLGGLQAGVWGGASRPGLAPPSCLHSTHPTPPQHRAAAPPQKHTWTKGLSLRNFEDHQRANERLVGEMKELSGEAPWARPLPWLLASSCRAVACRWAAGRDEAAAW